jgi:hypothetical protein
MIALYSWCLGREISLLGSSLRFIGLPPSDRQDSASAFLAVTPNGEIAVASPRPPLIQLPPYLETKVKILSKKNLYFGA